MLQNLWPSRTASLPTVGVELTRDGVSLAINRSMPDVQCMAPAAGAQASTVSCAPAAWAAKLETLVKDHGLPKGTRANLVLPPESYALLLVEPPEVAPDELREAIRWRVRELVAFPVEDAIIDVFAFPEDAAKGRKTCFVAIAERAQLAPRVDAFRDSRLDLRSIDITELALRNLLPDDCGDAVAVLYCQGSTALIAVYKGARLFLSRRVDVRDLQDERTVDQMLLQLQRSVDYFDSQLGQGAVTTVLCCMPSEFERNGIRLLQEMLPFPVHSLGQWLESRGGGRVLNTFAAATGGAWRRAS